MKATAWNLARLLAVAGAFLGMASFAPGQTVRPVISELGNPAKGRVEYVNDSDTPLNVVLEAKSFTVSETGEISYGPLDPAIHLKLSANSFRIQPRQTYYVFYEASTEAAPAWFVIYAAFSGFPFRTQQGLNVRLQLPHTVYLLPKQAAEKSQMHIRRAEYRPQSNDVLVEVENTSATVARVSETAIYYGKKNEGGPGFPVFPHSRRIMAIPLESNRSGEDTPQRVVLNFPNFKLEEGLQRSP